jgi:hypothetical protein
VYFWLPSDAVEELGLGTVHAFARRLAESLPFSFGYASPALLYHHDVYEATRRALRYPGFDVLNPGAATVDIGDRAAGVYWQTFLGKRLAENLGGLEFLKSELPAPITVEPLEGGGVTVTLGPAPSVGDNNRKQDLPLYKRFAGVIEPQLHIPQIVYFFDEEGLPDREAMEFWHRRFLDP